MRPSAVWITLAIAYGLFFSWYTSFDGPLTPAEIDRYTLLLQERGADSTRLVTWKRFMVSDTGDDFAMFNAIDLRAKPEIVPGVEPGDTSAEVLARYTTPFMLEAMKSAAHPVMIGTAASRAIDLWGIEGAEDWTMGGLVRYRSRRDLLEQAIHTRDAGTHAFKTAAMEKTIAYPLDPWFQLGDPRLLLALAFAVIGLAVHLRAARARNR